MITMVLAVTTNPLLFHLLLALVGQLLHMRVRLASGDTVPMALSSHVHVLVGKYSVIPRVSLGEKEHDNSESASFFKVLALAL